MDKVSLKSLGKIYDDNTIGNESFSTLVDAAKQNKKIGIFGACGSGKTYLIENIIDKLDMEVSAVTFDADGYLNELGLEEVYTPEDTVDFDECDCVIMSHGSGDIFELIKDMGSCLDSSTVIAEMNSKADSDNVEIFDIVAETLRDSEGEFFIKILKQ